MYGAKTQIQADVCYKCNILYQAIQIAVFNFKTKNKNMIIL